jgi:hypothetical protein
LTLLLFLSLFFFFFFKKNSMGSGHSQTADDLYKYESAIKGIQLLSAFGASAITAPAVILALPFVGAYEYGRAREEELQSGRSVVDTVMGGLFGVIVSPLAPFYCFIVSMQEILGYNVNHQKKMITKKYLSRADNVIRLDFSHYNVAITGCPGTGKVLQYHFFFFFF